MPDDDDYVLDDDDDLPAARARRLDETARHDWHRPVTQVELEDGCRYIKRVGPADAPGRPPVTLTDWERYLLPLVRQAEILGELPLTQEHGQQLGKFFGQRLAQRGLTEAEHSILNQHRAAFAVFLVIQGIYEYEMGDYWSSISRATGLELDANWTSRLGQLFETIIRTLGLNTFPDYPGRAQRFVSRILGHGGIPQHCLDDYFNNMLRPAVTHAGYRAMAVEELIEEWLLHSSGRYQTDQPVLRFLEFGGKVAEDFVERTRQLAGEYLETGLVAAAEDIGLPQRIVEAFQAWAVEAGGLVPEPSDESSLRLRRPELALDPWGQGLTLRLPPQQVPVTLSQAEIAYRIQAGERAWEVPTRVRRAGFDLRTDELRLPLDNPADSYRITLWVDGRQQREWLYRGPQSERPMLAFAAESGILLRPDRSLPARRLWLLYPRQAQLNVMGVAAPDEEFPRLPWGWASYRAEEWDLTGASGLALTYGDTLFELPVRADEGAQRPYLVGGNLYLASALQPGDVPLYVGVPPALRVPLVGRTSQSEELTRWRLTLRSQWAAHPHLDINTSLLDLRPYLKTVESAFGQLHQQVELPLDLDCLLGPAAYGSFVVRLRGPLGRDAELPLRILPQLAVTGHETLYLPDSQAGPQPARVSVETGAETRIELQSEEGDSRLQELTRHEDRWLQVIEAGPETTFVEINVVKTVPNRVEEMRVPVRIPVPRLRWALQDTATTIPLSQLLKGQLIMYPVEALRQAQSPVLMIELPGVDTTTVRLTLHLQDADGKDLQQFRLTASRRQQAGWRFELGRFIDTISHSDAPVLRFMLELAGLPGTGQEVQIPLMRLTQSLAAEDIRVTPVISNHQITQLTLSWHSVHPLRNRFIRFWSLWRPWDEPVYRPIPDEVEGEFVMQLDPAQPQLRPGKYRLELGIADPWSPPAQLARPEAGAPNTVDAWLVTPGQWAEMLSRQGRTRGGSFGLAVEYAIIEHEQGTHEKVEAALRNCYENIDSATLDELLAFVDHLRSTDKQIWLKATQLRMFAPKRVNALLDGYRKRDVDPEQLRRYLSNMPRAETLPLDTVRILLDVPFGPAQIAALLRQLMQNKEHAAISYILDHCRAGLLSDEDALALMTPQMEFAVTRLEQMGNDPLALRLLGRLSPARVPRVGGWVHCVAGWGRVAHMERLADGLQIEQLIAGRAGLRLYVTLRPQHDAECVVIELLDGYYDVQFQQAPPFYRCTRTRVCCFISRDRDLVCGDHNRMAHGGIGAQFVVEQRRRFVSSRRLKFSPRAPSRMLV